jgi:hypothetical protein
MSPVSASNCSISRSLAQHISRSADACADHSAVGNREQRVKGKCTSMRKNHSAKGPAETGMPAWQRSRNQVDPANLIHLLFRHLLI